MFGIARMSNTIERCQSALSPTIEYEDESDPIKTPAKTPPKTLSESLSGLKVNTHQGATPVKRSVHSKKTLPGSKLLKLLNKTRRRANR